MRMMAQVHKVEFDRGTNARDLQEQLAVVAGYNRSTFCHLLLAAIFGSLLELFSALQWAFLGEGRWVLCGTAKKSKANSFDILLAKKHKVACHCTFGESTPSKKQDHLGNVPK